MKELRPRWVKLIRRRRRAFLKFLHESAARQASLTELADNLVGFIERRVVTIEDAKHFWAAVVPTLAKCGSQATYELPFAPEAYAWLHLLDRYARTWYALQRMVQSACFPLGKHGVNVLDVGTGPGPSVLAIEQFYRSLSEFSVHIGEPRLMQPCQVTEVELSWANNIFRSRFREFAPRDLRTTITISDLSSIDPKRDRASLREHLINDEVWDANNQAQSLHRYRLIVLSNFVTDLDDFASVRPALLAILNDLQPGSIALVIGAAGAHYPKLYEQLDRLALEAGLRRRIAGRRVISRATDRQIILQAARAVAQHISNLEPMPEEVLAAVGRSLDGLEPWGRPSSIRVYRRNRRRAAA